MHPSSESATGSARNDYAPRSYPWLSTTEPISYPQAQAMLSAAYASYGASQAQSQAFPSIVQNDETALELAHHDYQNQLRGHINAYSLATAVVPDDQLPSFYQHQPSAASMALQQYADATGYQFQPPNPQAPSSVTENILAPHLPAALPLHPQPTRATLHFSNLEPWMDAEYFNKLAVMMNWQNVILKIPSMPSNEGVGSFVTNGSLVPNNPGYCFMTFPSPNSAVAVLESLTEGDKPKAMPNSKRQFVVTWATVPASSARTNAQRADSFGNDASTSGLFAPGNLSLLNLHTPPAIDDHASQPSNRQQEFSIFVGDLAPETTNSDLIAVFRDPILGLRNDREPKFVAPFLSCKSAKIMVDPVLGISKGYGFVRFGTPMDASRALIEMQGLYCLSRPMRISQATAKARPQGYPAQSAAPVPSNGTPPPNPFTPTFDYDIRSIGSDRGTGSTLTSPTSVHPGNTAFHGVFVGGLSGLISEDTLRTFFGPFGDIHYVKIPPGKGCGFVQFVRKADAEAAISKMQGFPIGGGRVRLSWGRSQYKAAQAAAQVARLGTSINDTAELQGLSEMQTAQTFHPSGVNNAGLNNFPRPRGLSELQNPNTFSLEAPYNVENAGTLDQYDMRVISSPHSVVPVPNDLASTNLSRSHTFPTFNTFGGELGSFSPPANVPASRTVAGLNPRSQYINAYGLGSGAAFGGPVAPRGSISQRDLDAMENGHMIEQFSDGVHGIYPNHVSGPFPVNEVIRQERSGSGSTVATTASDRTPPPQPMKNDFLDLAENFAALSFGQNPSFGGYPAYHLAEAKGVFSSALGPYVSNKAPTGQQS
ncbi:RRM protein [Tulasnella sp. 417]|nr:RRM protein [Tulasnella sp. 417]